MAALVVADGANSKSIRGMKRLSSVPNKAALTCKVRRMIFMK
uniref:Uncharacterized protein n=1 Tax=Vibrio sp. F12 FF_152 TaxID=1652829 RepID=A0A0H3ZVU4_9VIBR|nr:hypothetical protein [Vibrio sp. F12 FF_152]